MPPLADRLDQLWTRGTFAGDAQELRALAASAPGDARAVELLAFATIAAVLAADRGAGLDAVPDGLPPAASILGHAAIALRAAVASRPEEAGPALDRMEQALHEAEGEVPPDPRLGAARAWADLAIAEAALAGGAGELARRRLFTIGGSLLAPLGAQVAACMRLGLADGMEEPARGMTQFVRAAELARAAGAAGAAAERFALLYAGIYALLLHLPEARDLLEGAVAEPVPPAASPPATLGRIFLTVDTAPSDDRAFEHVAQGIRLAAESGDYLCYLVLISLGARLYESRDKPADAIATLDNGIAQLDAVGGALLAAPLVMERDALAERLGPDRYREASVAASRLRSSDRITIRKR